MMDLITALITQSPSLELQRAAHAEICRLNALVGHLRCPMLVGEIRDALASYYGLLPTHDAVDGALTDSIAVVRAIEQYRSAM